MANEFITIQEAAELCNKSIQTIRRAIKSKKLKSKRKKTPQGFNYLINRSSLSDAYGITFESVEKKVKERTVETKAKKTKAVKAPKAPAKAESKTIDADDFKSFTVALEKMISQHGDERQNFLRLINTLQEKVFVLENQLNLLKAPQKSWYQVWK